MDLAGAPRIGETIRRERDQGTRRKSARLCGEAAFVRGDAQQGIGSEAVIPGVFAEFARVDGERAALKQRRAFAQALRDHVGAVVAEQNGGDRMAFALEGKNERIARGGENVMADRAQVDRELSDRKSVV